MCRCETRWRKELKTGEVNAHGVGRGRGGEKRMESGGGERRGRTTEQKGVAASKEGVASRVWCNVLSRALTTGVHGTLQRQNVGQVPTPENLQFKISRRKKWRERREDCGMGKGQWDGHVGPDCPKL